MFKQLSVRSIAKRLNQERADERIVAKVAVDSRKCEENSLFVALSGDQVDGHEYLEMARKQGPSQQLFALITKNIILVLR